MTKTKETLTEKPAWSFNTSNTDFHGSNLPYHKRKAYIHYQKCIQASNLHFLSDQAEGLTINLCCGNDPTGSIKVDVDKKMLHRRKKGSLDPSEFIIADVHYPPFREQSCDTIIIDPPFSFYSRFKWILNVAKLARKKLIVSHPCTNLKIPGFTRELYFTNSKSIFLRLWWVYTREERGRLK